MAESIEAQLVWPVAALLGEGPAWFAEDATLRFVDIKRGHLHHHPGDATDRTTRYQRAESLTAKDGFYRRLRRRRRHHPQPPPRKKLKF